MTCHKLRCRPQRSTKQLEDLNIVLSDRYGMGWGGAVWDGVVWCAVLWCVVVWYGAVAMLCNG